jgi:Ca2+-binding RTX toxin-like protein
MSKELLISFVAKLKGAERMSDLTTNLSELYVAMFGRAPDAGGLEYWSNELSSGKVPNLQGIAQLMYETGDARAYYPVGADNGTVISSFYQNVLGRTPDAEGLAYWVNELSSGRSFGSLVVEMVQAVREYAGEDDAALASQRLFENRVEVSEVYAALGGDPAGASAVLENVTDQAESVSRSKTQLAQARFEELRTGSNLQSYSDADDDITGTEGPDAIDSGAGFDTIEGLGGSDILVGGSGDDELFGGNGQDFLDGGTGADRLYAGSDYTREYVSGYYDDNNQWVSAYNVVTPEAHQEILNGGGGADLLYGGYGRDTLIGGGGADSIYGEEDGSLRIDDEYNILAEGFEGRLFDDFIDAGAGNDTVRANYGDDVIDGGAGDDLLDGDEGDDTIIGGLGDDALYGSTGADYLDGGAGNDEIQVGGSGSYNTADAAEDSAFGGAGDDDISGLEGNDSADGGSGNDEIYYTRTDLGGLGVITAGEGEDYISIDYSGDRVTDRVVVDLSEEVSAADEVYIYTNPRTSSSIEIRGFELGEDGLDLTGGFNLYGNERYSKYESQDFSYSGDLYANYVQLVSSPGTAWDQPSEQRNYDDPESFGKGVFVIQGDSAASLSAADAASVIDLYGNNATYEAESAFYFLLNVEGKGTGVYRFEDDTGGDNRVVTDEITPIALLTGVDTADITLNNADFFV